MPIHTPVHPGSTIKESIAALEPKISITRFADYIGVSRSALSAVLNEKAGVTAEMSIRLAGAFGQPSKDIWFRWQTEYDFWQASRGKKHSIKPLNKAAA